MIREPRIRYASAVAALLVLGALVVSAAAFFVRYATSTFGPDIVHNDTTDRVALCIVGEHAFRPIGASIDPGQRQAVEASYPCGVFDTSRNYIGCLRLDSNPNRSVRLVSMVDTSVAMPDCPKQGPYKPSLAGLAVMWGEAAPGVRVFLSLIPAAGLIGAYAVIFRSARERLRRADSATKG